MDLPASEPERIKTQINDLIGLDTNNILNVSGKTEKELELLELIIKAIPS